ncbi:MAG: serine hydrolase [Chloroflexi bacterium]|nr:serine hydrolase [Chloroflexota bacterium]
MPLTSSATPRPVNAGPAATPVDLGPTAAARPHQDDGLLSAVVRALGPDAEDAGVVVRRLTDGTEARWNAERVFYAASLFKLEVLYEAFRQRQDGRLDFGAELAVDGEHAAEDLGTLSAVPRGPAGGLIVADAVRAMVTLSDNTSATLLLDLLGNRTIDTAMASIGLTSSSVNTTELPTTAADMARLMEAIVRGEGLDAGSAAEMTRYLLDQETRYGIPRGTPAGIGIGNKTGTWPGATHDVAVVMAPRGAYVLAVLTDHSWDWDLITRVSRAVYEYLDTPVSASGR